jgi:hypothetical protein
VYTAQVNFRRERLTIVIRLSGRWLGVVEIVNFAEPTAQGNSVDGSYILEFRSRFTWQGFLTEIFIADVQWEAFSPSVLPPESLRTGRGVSDYLARFEEPRNTFVS